MEKIKPIEIIKIEKKYKVILEEIDDFQSVSEIDKSYKLDGDFKIIELNLNNCNISHISESILVISLKKLSIAGNKIINIDSLKKLKELEYLNLNNNQIKDISVLADIEYLDFLNISNNEIYDLSPLYDLFLRDLNLLAYNNPLIYPPKYTRLDNYEIIDWFNSLWENANRIIQECLIHQNETLDLGNLGLTDLSRIPLLYECRHLKKLIISNEWAEYENEWIRKTSENDGLPNNIYLVPSEISKLTNLKKLIIGGDWKSKRRKIWNRWRIRSFSVFNKIKNLHLLNLSNNQIHGNISLSNFEDIEILHLNNNRITSVKINSILENVEELYLSNNLISDISFLNKLPDVSTADFHSNRITTLLPILDLLKFKNISVSKWQLNTINLIQNPLVNPVLEIVEQGIDSILSYFEQYKASQYINIKPYFNRDIKLILVGNSDVGKSTLVEYFLTNKLNSNIASTHWMKIQFWITKHKGKTYNIRIFDFGGQEYYHDTHYLFFTQQTAYLLLWNENSNKYGKIPIEQKQTDGTKIINDVECFPIEYWLNSIVYHTKNRKLSIDEQRITKILDQRDVEIQIGEEWSKKNIQKIKNPNDLENPPNVLITQNKVDNINDTGFLNEFDLQESYSEIFEFSSISVKSQRGIENHKNLLFELFDRIPLVDRELLGTWGYIKEKIENERHLNKKISILEFKKYCNKEIKKLPEIQGVEKLPDGILFNNISIKSFAQYLNTIGLVLYFPEEDSLKEFVFLNQNDIIQDIYNVLLNLNHLNGKFDENHVKKVLGKSTFDYDCEHIINIMCHFKMIIKHPSKEKSYIAPLYLHADPPKSIKLFLSTFQKPICRFIFNNFIHKHIVLEFFQKYGQDIIKDSNNDEAYLYWKNGIVLKDITTDEIVLVKFCNVDDNNSEAYIDVYRMENSVDGSFSQDVINSLENICNDKDVTKTVTVDGVNFIPLAVIYKAEEDSNWIFMYKEKYYNLKEFKNYLKSPIKMKKIFISYSKTDTQYLIKLENHLSVLKRNGNIDTWNCRQLIPGEKWDGKIKQELEEADIILFLVSDDFLATDYIWDIEIKRAIERENENPAKVKVIPIIVRNCFWEESPLGVYNTAPPKAQILSVATDIDTAFKEVVVGIKNIIQ